MHTIYPGMDVSRETFERLELYLETLKKWNRKINLVSPETINHAWDRHIIDSAQVWSVQHGMPSKWVDIGSGGGFPGMILAILMAETAPEATMTLIESDQRKCAFLRTIKRELGLSVNVIATRIESAESQSADIVSARALAPLDQLLSFARLHMAQNGTALFLKGQSWKKEVADAQTQWNFAWHSHKSITDSNAVILEVKDLVHV